VHVTRSGFEDEGDHTACLSVTATGTPEGFAQTSVCDAANEPRSRFVRHSTCPQFTNRGASTIHAPRESSTKDLWLLSAPCQQRLWRRRRCPEIFMATARCIISGPYNFSAHQQCNKMRVTGEYRRTSRRRTSSFAVRSPQRLTAARRNDVGKSSSLEK
jgi:hypothetical protein